MIPEALLFTIHYSGSLTDLNGLETAELGGCKKSLPVLISYFPPGPRGLESDHYSCSLGMLFSQRLLLKCMCFAMENIYSDVFNKLKRLRAEQWKTGQCILMK